jgi:hypothetical protein
MRAMHWMSIAIPEAAEGVAGQECVKRCILNLPGGQLRRLPV